MRVSITVLQRLFKECIEAAHEICDAAHMGREGRGSKTYLSWAVTLLALPPISTGFCGDWELLLYCMHDDRRRGMREKITKGALSCVCMQRNGRRRWSGGDRGCVWR